MSTLNYLGTLEQSLRLTQSEKNSIETSKDTIITRLKSYFGDRISSVQVFGSYKRYVNLSRRADPHSDVDLLVVFDDPTEFEPQTYINQLKAFAELRYSTSEIKQSNPSLKLNLDHITFELTPAIHSFGSYYKIPDKADSYSKWISTNPFEIDSLGKLMDVDDYRRLTRLIKYWNACYSGRLFNSFKLEEHILGFGSFTNTQNLKQALFTYLKNLGSHNLTSQSGKNYLENTKNTIVKIEELERAGHTTAAEDLVKKIFPPL